MILININKPKKGLKKETQIYRRVKRNSRTHTHTQAHTHTNTTVDATWDVPPEEERSQ